jgi:hypothetical protein
MAMTAGTVTVDGSGVASGGGMARAIYDAFMALPGVPTGNIPWKQAVAPLCNAMGSGIVSYIQGNAVVDFSVSGNAHVTSQSLGRTPSPNNANTAIQAPSSPVDVPLTGTGSVQ